MFKVNEPYEISVLDKGHVHLVDYMGNDLMVVNAARVSFAKESEYEYVETAEAWKNVLSDKDKKLIKYLAKHKHWTPFAHPQITLRIKAPISIRTQLFKHKVGFVENEVSRRYVDDVPDVYIPRWRTAPTNGAKQGSDGFVEIGSDDGNNAHIAYTMAAKMALDTYNTLLGKGIAPSKHDLFYLKEHIRNGIGQVPLQRMLESVSKDLILMLSGKFSNTQKQWAILFLLCSQIHGLHCLNKYHR